MPYSTAAAALEQIQNCVWSALVRMHHIGQSGQSGQPSLVERFFEFITGSPGRVRGNRVRIVVRPRAGFGTGHIAHSHGQPLRASTCDRTLSLSDYRRSQELITPGGTEGWYQQWLAGEIPEVPDDVHGVLLLALLSFRSLTFGHM